jgi:hypothetical protein
MVASPRMKIIMASVVMKGLMRTRAIMMPFPKPTSIPQAMAASTAANQGCPLFSTRAAATPVRVTTEPTDRSNPPETSRMVMPTEMTAMEDMARTVALRIAGFRNSRG